MKLEKRGYADKHDGNPGLVKMLYSSTELGDGTLVISGLMRKELVKAELGDHPLTVPQKALVFEATK